MRNSVRQCVVAVALGGLVLTPVVGCGGGGAHGTGTGGSQPGSGGQSGSGGTTNTGGTGGGGAGTPGAGGITGKGGSSGGGGVSASGGAGAGGAGAGGTAASGGGAGNGAGGGSGGASGNGGQAGSAGSSGGSDVRLMQNFNQAWKFKRADVSGADATAFDDSAWDNVGLPHSFSLPYFMASKFYVGYGWYRKHFAVPSSWTGKSVSLEFQAAFDQAQVYVNGTKVGEHIGGYNGFSIDITSAIKTGDNVVAVRLNNTWNAQLPPLTGDHTFQGGLYRNVFVVVTDPLHVTWYGTWVTTPTLATSSGSSSTVEIKTEVQNNRSAAVTATLKTDIVDKDGKVVATVSSQQQIAAGKAVTFDQTTPAISSPSLWHPDHPTMYRALSTLSDGTGTADAFTTPFGFRWFSWSASQGFSLNGSHYWIQGANVHQDHAGWGNGVSDSALTRDVQMVKDAGMNFIRGSHYPKAPAFADACDQLGILFWSENNFWGGFGGAGGWPYNGAYPSTSADYDAFDANVLASLTDMIRIHRNHPSIIAWSMGNEDFFNGGPADRVAALLKKEVALTHQLDPAPTGRPAAIGGAQSKIAGVEAGTLGDVAGYNGDGVVVQRPGRTQHGFRIRSRRQLDAAGQLRSRLGEFDRHERPGRPTGLAQRNFPVVHVRLRQPDGQPVHERWARGLLPHPQARLLLVSEHLREGRAADLAGRGYGGGIEAHVRATCRRCQRWMARRTPGLLVTVVDSRAARRSATTFRSP